MKIKLHVLVLAALLAPAATAQDCETQCPKAAKKACEAAALAAAETDAECDEAKKECKTEKQGCDAKKAAELAAAEGECAAKKAQCAAEKAELAAAESECAAKKAHCAAKQAELAAAEGECAKQKAACAAELAAADGQCDSKKASACSTEKGELAAADGSCSKSAPAVVPASAQLASLIQPNRVAGVVIDGKAYLGEKATKSLMCMVRSCVSEKIASVCEESRNCEKTLASNVDKALAGNVCAIQALTARIDAGKIDSIIVNDESVLGGDATAMLAKIGSCPEYQGECKKRAGIATPKTAVQLASFEPVPVDRQLAALVQNGRVAGLVVDGKAYLGGEAADVLAKMIRCNVSTKIKANCEQSRACEKTLASNVDKALATNVCAGTQLVTLIESGEIDGVLVGEEVLEGAKAKAAVKGILSCPEFQSDCRGMSASQASAKAECDGAQKAKAACGTTASL